MGADGHVRIWRRSRVEEAFPDCEELFSYIPTHYCSGLEGVMYDHCYHGDNLHSYWGDWHEWHSQDETVISRLVGFVAWLEKNGDQWEVWT